jgi:hypothetical protein
VDTYETLPTPPIRSIASSVPPQKYNAAILPNLGNDEEERIQFLKTLLWKMADILPQNGVADAFRLLVRRV